MASRIRDAARIGRLDGLRVPEPPTELRDQAVSAAEAALAIERTTDVWSRLWTSSALRLAWTTAVLALLLANVTATLLSRPPAGTEGERVSTSVARLPAELAEIVNLPPIDSGVLTRLP